MQLKLIKEGSKGSEVLAWEEFLRDEEHYLVAADGFFDIGTVNATKLFQRQNGLDDDGVVGGMTWGVALEKGFHALEDDDDSKAGLNWPPPPNFKPASHQTREKLFGQIFFKPAPTPNNPEAITITNDWAKNVVTVVIPQLAKIPGIDYDGRKVGKGPPNDAVMVHTKAADSLIKLWQAWEDRGLLEQVLTWAGLWVPRFMRGSRTTLSNHTYGTAFDINAPWNGLRKTPALVGQKGSIRELVPVANELGWYWGGHFNRKDGMHFEFVGRNT